VFPDLQNVDWNSYYTTYKKFLPHINNNYDFAEMLSEMLGEMNVSHTGCYYRPNVPNSDATASLGLLYDYAYTGDGVKVAEVLQGGPVDLAASTIKTGHIIRSHRREPDRRRDGLLQAAQSKGRQVYAPRGLRSRVE
jgi:tricorn protease